MMAPDPFAPHGTEPVRSLPMARYVLYPGCLEFWEFRWMGRGAFVMHHAENISS